MNKNSILQNPTLFRCALLLCCCIGVATVSAQNAERVTVKMNDVPIERVMRHLEQQNQVRVPEQGCRRAAACQHRRRGQEHHRWSLPRCSPTGTSRSKSMPSTSSFRKTGPRGRTPPRVGPHRRQQGTDDHRRGRRGEGYHRRYEHRCRRSLFAANPPAANAVPTVSYQV